MLGDRVDFIVDGGASSIGVESTVLDLCGEVPTILRPGGMERRTIEAVIGRVEVCDRALASPTSPGQLSSHYAPRIPLILVPQGGLDGAELSAWKGMKLAALAFDGAGRRLALDSGRYDIVFCLSESSNARAAAACLFARLHEIDALTSAGIDLIVAEKAPGTGLGPAINDRLYKASRK
jgi:L-threonylcarbamoyladenylate synthase